MFGDKLSKANAKLTAICAILASTGFKIEAATVLNADTEVESLPTVAAFTAHLTAQQKTAIDAAVATSATQLSTLTSQLASATAETTALRTGLTDAGVRVAAFVTAETVAGKPTDTAEQKATAAATANAATVKEAVGIAIATKSAKQIAGAGHPHALEVPAGSADPKADAAAAPENKEAFMTTLNSIKDPAARQTYFRKHSAKFVS